MAQGSSISSVPAKGERNQLIRAPRVHSPAPCNLWELPVPAPGQGSSSLLPGPCFWQRLPSATYRQGREK